MEAALSSAPLLRSATEADASSASVTLSAPDMMCGTCIRDIETALLGVRGVRSARANLSSRRVTASYDPDRASVDELVATLGKAGFKAAEIAEGVGPSESARASELIPRLGVAGFAAANIMLLSVSIWSGEASDMDSSTITLFHWISALVALPAIAYAGQPFFRSALAALSAHRLNMDVPISLGITLATGMSLFETMHGSPQVYFDAATALVFFLLIGRVLDERMRVKARGAAENLLSLKALSAVVILDEGTTKSMPSRALQPGMRVSVAAGERIAADGIVTAGQSEVDESLITGETLPRAVGVGDHVHAGTLNGGAPLQFRVTAADENTLLAEIGRLMLAAEQSRGRYVRLADRAARVYAPAVHILGLLTFVLWLLFGAGWETSLMHAIAVLIITCPCALALAVPAVQVAAMSRLFGRGIIVKAADGLERLAEIDAVVFDKTGTLTTAEVSLDAVGVDLEVLARAAALGASSRHPYAQAIVRAARARGIEIEALKDVREVPGSGLSIKANGREERLGSASWCGAPATNAEEASLWYVREDDAPIAFNFAETLRDDARETVRTLEDSGYAVELLSGDRVASVARMAEALGIEFWHGGVRPDEKLGRIGELRAAGLRPLMVGDGLNDAPALAAGYASMSPASAIDISQAAADAVFQGSHLAPVVEALSVAKAAHRMALQNFAVAIAYNAAFVPLAVLGYVTPLIAGLAMSTSSIVVTVNAVRLRTMRVALQPAKRRA